MNFEVKFGLISKTTSNCCDATRVANSETESGNREVIGKAGIRPNLTNVSASMR